jgi:hypothetical protein
MGRCLGFWRRRKPGRVASGRVLNFAGFCAKFSADQPP